jgi:hypothetical protein
MKKLISILAAIVWANTLLAQNIAPNALICKTSDGTILIFDNHVVLRDYAFTKEKSIDDGVVTLRDTNTCATAMLDARDKSLIRLTITDRNSVMNIVIDRKDISSGKQPGDGPFSPLGSREIHPSENSVAGMILR